MARSITKKLIGLVNELLLVTLDRHIEETIAAGIIQTDQGQQLSLDPEFVRGFVAQLNQSIVDLSAQTTNPIVLCSPMIRPHLKGLIDRFIPGVIVLSHNEITPNVSVKSAGTVRLANAS